MEIDGHRDMSVSAANNPSGNPGVGEDEARSVEHSTHPGDVEHFRQMQLEMLRRENEHLCSKLDTVTAHLRAHDHTVSAVADLLFPPQDNRFHGAAVPSMPFKDAFKQPGKVGKVANGKEVLLVFEGDLATCDRSVISSKLLHFKRLLHRRLQSRLSPSEEDMNILMHVLVAVHQITPPQPWERIRVQVASHVIEESAALLRKEIASLVSFTQGVDLSERNVTVVELHEEAEDFQRATDASVTSRPARIQVVVTAFNHGVAGEERINDATLSELCEPQSVSWVKLFGKYVNIGWVNRDLDRLDADEATVVCSSHDKRRAITLYYPAHLQSFFADKALRRTLEPGNFLHGILSDHVDSIQFQEWRAGSIIVPVFMPEWIALIVWELARNNDPWFSFLTEGAHSLQRVCLDGMQCELHALACSPAASASIQLFFELERQQELIRRKIEKLERLVQCKDFVAHMETLTSRLQLHATELCEGIRMKQETPHTLDALCSQLASLSMQCENCIDHALDAMQAVGEAPQGEEAVLHEQVRKILQARNAKQHVDKLKEKVRGALEMKLSSQNPTVHIAAAPNQAAAATSDDLMGDPESIEQRSLELEHKFTSAFEAWGCETGRTVEMLQQLQQGLVVQKEQQEKAESIGVAELQARFKQYIMMLEEHEEVEDTMLFPMLKSLFPQSAEAVDRVLDPERHKGVDMLNERVGRLLQQLHERHRSGQQMVLNASEMKKVVEALERLNDYMLGHIRYEEEVTMPWLRKVETAIAV